MIIFEDKSELTIDEAVLLLENEKKLGSWSYYHNGYRNAVGVLEKWYFSLIYGFPISTRRLKSEWLTVCLNTQNSRLKDLSPESRCLEMINYLKALMQTSFLGRK